MHDDDDLLLDAMRAGARGYLLKGAEREEITRAVLTVAAGGTAFGGDVGPRIAAYAARPPTPPRASSSPSSAAASTRCSSIRPRDSANHEIAAHLFLSEKTVFLSEKTVRKPRGHDPRCATMPLRSLGRGIAG